MTRRILQISNYYHPHVGGIEQVTRGIAKALKGRCEQKVICFNEDAQDGGLHNRGQETVREMVDGVEVIRCGCVGKVASQSLSPSFGRELRQTMAQLAPDTVVFHYPNPFEAHYLLSLIPNDVRLVVFWHLDITRQKVLGKAFTPQTMRLLERADVVVATSPTYMEGSPYLRRYRQKCVVIPNCIDEERLRPTEEALAREEQIRAQYDGRILCFGVGRHVEYKGFINLIRASRLLDDRYRIVIAGEGPLTKQLKRRARGDDKIRFAGRLSDEELIAHYLAMDVLCFPSITKNEAFGIALAEGMYFGKPAVTFTIPGSGVNYVNAQAVTGIEVPNRDAEAYAVALGRLADSALRKRLGAAARKRVVDKFLSTDFEKNIHKLLDF